MEKCIHIPVTIVLSQTDHVVLYGWITFHFSGLVWLKSNEFWKNSNNISQAVIIFFIPFLCT